MLINGVHFSDTIREHNGLAFHNTSSICQYYTKGIYSRRVAEGVVAEVEVISYFQDEVGMRIILGFGMVIHVTDFSGFYCSNQDILPSISY